MTKMDTILSKLEHSRLKHVFLEDSHESSSSEVGFACKECSSYIGSLANSFCMILAIKSFKIIIELVNKNKAFHNIIDSVNRCLASRVMFDQRILVVWFVLMYLLIFIN